MSTKLIHISLADLQDRGINPNSDKLWLEQYLEQIGEGPWLTRIYNYHTGQFDVEVKLKP